jgi:Pro-kumamolisin, activation domain
MITTRGAQAVAGAAVLAAGLALTGASGPASAGTGPARPLPGSATPFTASSRVIGNAPGAQRLSIQVWLRPRVAAAQRFADAVSTPGNPLFGHFLSPDRYTARFGATPGAAHTVEAWLRSAGFTRVSADAQRSYVRATAATSTIEAALRTRLRLYRPSATGATGHRLFVTGWSTGYSVIKHGRWVLQSENGASAGGPSLEWNQPAYQKGVVPAALARPRRGDHSKGPVRSVPDLSADADPFTGLGTGLLSFPAGKLER